MKRKILREDVRVVFRGLSCLLEILLLCVIYYLVWRKGYENENFPDYYVRGKYVLAGLYGLLLSLLFGSLEGFLFDQKRSFDLVLGQIIALIIVNFFTYFQLSLIANHLISPVPMLFLLVLEIAVAVLLIIAFTRFFRFLYAPQKMLLVYGSDDAVSLKIKMDTRRDKFNVTDLISHKEGYDAICRRIESFDAVILNDLPARLRNDLIKFCYRKNLAVYVVPKISDILVRGGKTVTLFDTPLIQIKKAGIDLHQRAVKRLMDIVLSLVILLLTSPLLIGVAIAIKCEDKGPIFFKQKRLSLGGKEFDILKFRSMIPNAERITGAVLSAGKSDPRITRVGRFVRATRLDELPQFINILKGDMSIVGPRPERRVFVEEFQKTIPEFEFRTKVKGGLTGFAQIYGKYNTSPYDKLRLDLMYIENYSLLLDLRLILLTVKIIFSKESTEGTDLAKKTEEERDALLKKMKKN
ncbi:MAG: exopolysaccharide biosynthesis polyprenyl glycosylphosphotransferase [Clostridia bacterium]|nr:exopolysaccharide biosynthesis polyprenyl glycosylphosphotransferase [Clostridia bacterium]